MAKKLSIEEFVINAIKTLRTGDYKGIHTVYSGFNVAFKEYFGEGSNPIVETKKLQDADKIVVRPVKGGVCLYIKGEEPVSNAAKTALAKMGLK